MEDRIGIDFSASGSVMSKRQLEEQRRKRGECLTCGQKCFQKKLFKMIPMTIHDQVLNGRCLKCKPLDAKQVLPAVSRPATRQDLERFTRSQSSLRTSNHSSHAPHASSVSHASSSSSSSPVQLSGRSQSLLASQTVNTMSRAASNDSLSAQSTNTAQRRPPIRRTVNLAPPSATPRSLNDASATVSTEQMSDYSHRSADSPNNNHIKAPSRIRSMTNDPRIAARNTWSRSSRSMDADVYYDYPPPPNSTTSPILEHSPKTDQSVLSAPPSSELDHMQKAVVAGMAARQLADKFRERKRQIRSDTISVESEFSEAVEREERFVTQSKQDDVCEQNSADSWGGPAQQEQFLKEPVHGILNRGGALKFDNAAPISTMNAGSSRTMSSMSSGENESNNSTTQHSNGTHHQRSWKPAAEFAMKRRPQDVYEDEDDLSIDSREIENTNSKRSLSDSRSTIQEQNAQEQQALDRIARAHNDYVQIIKIMLDMPNSAVVQQEGLKDISNLPLSNEEYSVISEIGGLDLVLGAMKAHAASPEVQISACRAIWNLSATTQNQIQLVQEGALDSIISAMDAFPSDAEVQEKAMAALANLGAAQENQQLLLEKGTIDKIVKAMNQHSEDAQVQSKACSAITNFASYDSPLKRSIMESGGGGAVVISMIMHPEDIDLQEKALRALRNICANNDPNKIEVANVGGIDAVISAMQVHRDEPGVQEAGAWTLSNLAVNPNNKAVIGDSGGIDVVIRAMWVHSDNVGVQEWCCRALWTLSVDAQNRQVMMEVGGISAVVNAMQAHADAATVQEKGCGVLSNLAASDDQCKLRIVEEEALDAIIMAMVLHSDDKAVQDRACSVLKRLAIGPNIRPMQAANVGELVRLAKAKFPEKCREKANAILAVL